MIPRPAASSTVVDQPRAGFAVAFRPRPTPTMSVSAVSRGEEESMPATAFICVTCGTQYPPNASEPCALPDLRGRPPVRQSQRPAMDDTGRAARDAHQPLHATRAAPHRHHHGAEFRHRASRVSIETDAGNVLWDCLAHLDDASIAEIRRRGGIRAIAISHPHFYTTMNEWSRVFDDARSSCTAPTSRG